MLLEHSFLPSLRKLLTIHTLTTLSCSDASFAKEFAALQPPSPPGDLSEGRNAKGFVSECGHSKVFLSPCVRWPFDLLLDCTHPADYCVLFACTRCVIYCVASICPCFHPNESWLWKPNFGRIFASVQARHCVCGVQWMKHRVFLGNTALLPT